MKVGILTFHRGTSPGAFLQAYFLWQALRAQGADVVFLDPPARPMYVARCVDTLRARRRGLAFMASELRSIFAHRLSHHQTLPKLPVHKSTVASGLDLVVIGSDEVWNVKNRYYGFMYPMMWAAWAKCPVVSYAPSMGGLSAMSDLPDEAWRAIAGYHRISVRDANTQVVAEQRLQQPILRVCDPTLLLRKGQHTFEPPVKEPFILIYTTGRIASDRVADIRAYATQHGLRTVSAGPSQPWCDLSLSHIHPLAAHALFERAACVYGGTFHGMVLARKFARPLAAEFGASKVTKSKCFLNAYCDPRANLTPDKSVASAWGADVDPAFNQTGLDVWVESSREYLSEAILPTAS